MGVLPAAYAVVTIGGVAISNLSVMSGNIVITNLSVEQLSLNYIKYTVNMQYNPSTFEAGTPNNLERFIQHRMSNGDYLVTLKFGYESRSPYARTISPMYVGRLINFSTKVNIKSVDYTMEAIGMTSNEYGSLINGKISFNYKTNIKEFIESFNGSDELPETYGKHFVFKCDPNLGALQDFFDESMIPDVAPQAGTTAMNLAYGFLYEVNDPDTNETKRLNAIYTFTVLSFLRCLVNKLNILCNKDDIKKSKMKGFHGHQFVLACDYYSPGGGKYGTISIVDTKDNVNRPSVPYVFNYGRVSKGDSLNNHNVLNWSCDYNDTAAFYGGIDKMSDSTAIINNLKDSMETSGSIALINGGAANTSTDSNNATSSNIIQNYLASTDKLGEMKEIFNYPYEGTLEILGNPDPIDICHKTITVVPLINGTQHHTAGQYLVTGVTHNIDSNAFYTTTYKCIRVEDEDVSGGLVSDTTYADVLSESTNSKNAIRACRNIKQEDIG